ncbi:MAG TPA: SWIM zinc finger family protein, partial [Candidatus Janibacter merdipullorum]|nr:SWIM zinc finger family protein [Candidatus Janibacter merdipullorum]
MVWDVDAATWLQGLTDDRIEDETDVGAFHRGTTYARNGRVTQVATLNRGRVVVAKVAGSGRESYQTIVSLHGDPGDDVIEWSARCSCPVGSDCKHSVAVILTVRDALGGVAEARPHWEEALAPLTREPSRERLDQGSPMALIVEPVVAARDPRDRVGSPRLRIRPTRRTKAGTWAKKYSWSEFRGYGWSGGATLARHRAALERLAALHDAMTKGRYAYAASTGPMYLDDIGPDVWSVLRGVRDAGVALIGSEAGEPVLLREDPVGVAVDVTRAPEGIRLRPVIEGATGSEGDELQLIGTPGHGVAVTGDEGLVLAPFVAPLDPDVDDLVESLRGLEVPSDDVERFLALYLARLRERVAVTSSDGTVDLPEAEPPRLHVRVGSEGRALRIELGFAYAAGERTHLVRADVGGAVPRDRSGEQTLLMGIEALSEVPGATSRPQGSTGWRLHPTVVLRGAEAIRVLTRVVPRLEEDPRVVVTLDDDLPLFEELDSEPRVTLHDAGTDTADWLDLHVTVTVGEVEVPFEGLFQALVRGEEIHQLESGEWFRLDHPVLADLRALIEESLALAEPEEGELRISRYQVDLWDELSALADVQVERAHAWRSRVETLRELETAPAPEVPDGLRATLRPYQLEGYHWLSTLWDADLGGVLADDMGLGKTVQTLALLVRAAAAGELDRPVLVVAPTSVVTTWEGEAERFAPDLRVRTLPQTHRRRGATVAEAVDGAQLVITSYAVLRIDAEQFSEVGWRGVILDEAQLVKNDRSKTHQALRRLSAPFVLAVTGTPLENSLMDLWSLLALAAPGLYPRRDRFSEVYRKPIESGAQPELLDRLRRRIRPLMLRRTKEQVALDLPPKQVQVLPVDLTPTHRRVYDRHLQRERKRVLGLLDDPEANRVAILASLTRLRQLSL